MIKYIDNFDLRTIANSGQCFRLFENSEDEFFILSEDKFLYAKKLENNKYFFDCDVKQFNSYYKKYFDLDYDYYDIKAIVKKNDKFLCKCIDYTSGLRILNQNKFETIISFIISQRKSVKAIQTSIDRLSKLAGKIIKTKYGDFYTFPSAKNILKLSSKQLDSIGLGYRKEYILNFCKEFEMGKWDLEAFDKLTSEDLIEKLMQIKGVGIKVASCIALFSYHRFDICPIDVWISRVIEREYGGKIPENYAQYIGLIQQYWFNYARLTKLA